MGKPKDLNHLYKSQIDRCIVMARQLSQSFSKMRWRHAVDSTYQKKGSKELVNWKQDSHQPSHLPLSIPLYNLPSFGAINISPVVPKQTSNSIHFFIDSLHLG